MKKSIFMALAGVMMVSSAAHAISVTGEAGEHYTNLGVGFGTESTGYSDWSGYMAAALLASAATCQPDK